MKAHPCGWSPAPYPSPGAWRTRSWSPPSRCSLQDAKLAHAGRLENAKLEHAERLESAKPERAGLLENAKLGRAERPGDAELEPRALPSWRRSSDCEASSWEKLFARGRRST